MGTSHSFVCTCECLSYKLHAYIHIHTHILNLDILPSPAPYPHPYPCFLSSFLLLFCFLFLLSFLILPIFHLLSFPLWPESFPLLAYSSLKLAVPKFYPPSLSSSNYIFSFSLTPSFLANVFRSPSHFLIFLFHFQIYVRHYYISLNL